LESTKEGLLKDIALFERDKEAAKFELDLAEKTRSELKKEKAQLGSIKSELSEIMSNINARYNAADKNLAEAKTYQESGSKAREIVKESMEKIELEKKIVIDQMKRFRSDRMDIARQRLSLLQQKVNRGMTQSSLVRYNENTYKTMYTDSHNNGKNSVEEVKIPEFEAFQTKSDGARILLGKYDLMKKGNIDQIKIAQSGNMSILRHLSPQNTIKREVLPSETNHQGGLHGKHDYSFHENINVFLKPENPCDSSRKTKEIKSRLTSLLLLDQRSSVDNVKSSFLLSEESFMEEIRSRSGTLPQLSIATCSQFF